MLRGRFIEGSKTLTFVGPLYEDVFNFGCHFVNGDDINIKMFRYSAPFSLMSGEKVKEYTIDVFKLKMNNALILVHNNLFGSKSACYPYARAEVRMAGVAACQTICSSIPGPRGLSGRFGKRRSSKWKLWENLFNLQGSNVNSVSQED